MFLIGLIVGFLIAGPVIILVLGLCKAAARGDEAMESALFKLEQETRERVHITGGGNGNGI
jgi:hypothetical protein